MPTLRDLMAGVLAQAPQQPQMTTLRGLLGQTQPNYSNGLLSGTMSQRVAKGIDEQAYDKYPRLRSYGLQYIPPTGGQTDDRQWETYPADERDNPMPGRPTIQQFNPKATVDDFMGEALHILPKVDSQVGQMRQQFIDSMTPAQQQKLQEQYKYSQDNYGEQRPFEQWRDMSGHDAWFRGNISGQWPSEIYTPQQIQLFQQLREYLSK